MQDSVYTLNCPLNVIKSPPKNSTLATQYSYFLFAQLVYITKHSSNNYISINYVSFIKDTLIQFLFYVLLELKVRILSRYTFCKRPLQKQSLHLQELSFCQRSSFLADNFRSWNFTLTLLPVNI